MVVSPRDIWGRTSHILFCDDNDGDNNYKYQYEDDDNFLSHLRRAIQCFIIYVRVPLFLLVQNYRYVALRHIRLLFKVKTMNTGH